MRAAICFTSSAKDVGQAKTVRHITMKDLNIRASKILLTHPVDTSFGADGSQQCESNTAPNGGGKFDLELSAFNLSV